jgi:radical SAM-linked protein
MDLPEAASVPQGGAATRLGITFRVDGDLRFVSHRDTLRLLRRALARAGLPLRFSEGFNPRPRMNLPLPRPVGLASEVELLVVEFTEAVDPDAALAALAPQLPVGMSLVGAVEVTSAKDPRPTQAVYRLDVGERDPDELGRCIEQILKADNVEITRNSPKHRQSRPVNVRPCIMSMHLDDGVIEFSLDISPGSTAKPAEIAGLFGYDVASINHRIRRMEVRWQ